MKNLKIKKECPFCPKNKSKYIYRTYHGLYRHIWKVHVVDRKGRHAWEPNQGPIEALRIYQTKYSKSYLVEVNGEEHINAIIDSYCKGINPSLREILRNGKRILS